MTQNHTWLFLYLIQYASMPQFSNTSGIPQPYSLLTFQTSSSSISRLGSSWAAPRPPESETGSGALQRHIDVTSWWLQRQNVVQTGGWGKKKPKGREICNFTSLGHQQIHSELFGAPLPVNLEQSIWIILPSRFTDTEMILFWRHFFLKLYYSNILLSLRKNIWMLGQHLEIACGISEYFLRPHSWPYSDLVHLKPFKFPSQFCMFSVPLAAQF